MHQEIEQVTIGLRTLFQTASDIYVDISLKECEVKVSVDEYQGEIAGRLVEHNVHYYMVDYCDTYPYKYVFSYRIKGALKKRPEYL